MSTRPNQWPIGERYTTPRSMATNALRGAIIGGENVVPSVCVFTHENRHEPQIAGCDLARLGLQKVLWKSAHLDPAHHQQHDETTNPGMVRGAAGARRASGHGRNDLDHDTPVRSRGGYMTMCSNDRLGRFANRSSHKFKSQRQPPERPSGFSVILRGRKRSLSPVTFACPVSSLSGLKRVGSSPIADGNCRGAHVAASALLSGLSQNDPYHRVQSAPCHLKYLSTARLRSVTRGGEFARNPCSKTFHIRARSADA